MARKQATKQALKIPNDDIDMNASDEDRVNELRRHLLRSLNLSGFDVIMGDLPFIENGIPKHRHCLVIVPLTPRQQARS